MKLNNYGKLQFSRPGPRAATARVAASLGAVAVVAGLVAGCDPKPAPSGQGAAPPQVGVLTIKPQRVVLLTELPGRTNAYQTADVRPQVSGVVKSRDFTEGTEVKAGQQLYQIDPATYQATYDSAQAALQKDQATLQAAQAQAERYRPLAAAQAISRQDYDNAVAAAAEARAAIAGDRASIEQARINLQYTKVQAPISGQIGRSSVTPGALLTASQTTALATITQLDPIYVDLTESSSEMLRLRQEMAAGQIQQSGPNQARVTLTLENGTKYSQPGTLQFAEVTVDQGTGTQLVRALFPNPQHLLLPGMFVRAELQEGVNDSGMLVPVGAVSHNTHGDPIVMLVGADNKVSQQIIQTSRMQGQDWIVTSGLKAGDRVVVDGLLKAKVGAVVQPVAPESQAS